MASWRWGSVAKEKGIKVDSYPIPGDIAWWKYDWTGDPKNKGDDWGHVAFVEKVHYDPNGKATGIEVSEYNWEVDCSFSSRKISASNPTAFIHILAYEEGVTSLHYLDCYEMACPGQTQKEWDMIASRVWNMYRCKDCESEHERAYIDSIASGFGGGNLPDSEDSEPDKQEVSGDYGKVTMSSPGKSKKKPDLYVKELKFKTRAY